MADECDVSKIVTAFLLNTCRLPPRISKHDVQAAVCCGLIATARPLDEECEVIPLITGSVAEFYIEPMLPHFGDIDVMILSWQYHEDIHRQRSYQLSFTTMSRYVRLLTVTYLATCTYRYVTYWRNASMMANTTTSNTRTTRKYI